MNTREEHAKGENYYATHKEKRKAYQKDYDADPDHKQEKKVREQKRYADKKEEILVYHKDYYADNKEEIKAKNKIRANTKVDPKSGEPSDKPNAITYNAYGKRKRRAALKRKQNDEAKEGSVEKKTKSNAQSKGKVKTKRKVKTKKKPTPPLQDEMLIENDPSLILRFNTQVVRESLAALIAEESLLENKKLDSVEDEILRSSNQATLPAKHQIIPPPINMSPVIPHHMDALSSTSEFKKNSNKRLLSGQTEDISNKRPRYEEDKEPELIPIKIEPVLERPILPIVKFDENKFKQIAIRLRGDRNDIQTDCNYFAHKFLEYLCTGIEPVEPVLQRSASFVHYAYYNYIDRTPVQVKREPGLKPKPLKPKAADQVFMSYIDRGTELGSKVPPGTFYQEANGYIDLSKPVGIDVESFTQPSALYTNINDKLIEEALANGGRLCGIINLLLCGSSAVNGFGHTLTFVVETAPEVKIAFVDPQQLDDNKLIIHHLTDSFSFYSEDIRLNPNSTYGELIFYAPIKIWVKEQIKNIDASEPMETETHCIENNFVENFHSNESNLRPLDLIEKTAPLYNPMLFGNSNRMHQPSSPLTVEGIQMIEKKSPF